MIRDTPPSDRERTFTAQIGEDGMLRFDRRAQWCAALLAWAKKRVIVTIAPASEVRSMRLNAYWWAVVVARVRAYYEGTRQVLYSAQQIHGMLCGNFIGMTKTPIPGVDTYISSTTLDKAAQARLVDEVRAYYYHTERLNIPAPNEPDEEVL